MIPTCLFKIQSIHRLTRRLTIARPVYALLALTRLLAVAGGSIPTPASAQEPDPAVGIIQADRRHVRPEIASRTFGTEGAKKAFFSKGIQTYTKRQPAKGEK